MTGIEPHLIAALRQDLAGFTVAAVDELLGPVASTALGREQSLPAQRAVRARPAEPLAVLTGCFVLGQPVTRAALERALPALGVDGAQRLKLVAAAGSEPGDTVRAQVDLRPYAAQDDAGTVDWWIVSDPGELATGKPLQPDHVLGVGGASLTLARSTMRRRTGSVLDLGTGCGVQSLHAARHAEQVTGTDISARALTMARLNWLLNRPGGLDMDCELLLGSMFEPVAGREFDLIISNPPFVITPRSAFSAGYEYRDAGRVGDRVVREMVAGTGPMLAPGGVAQFLGNWEIRPGETWNDRVSSWLDDAQRSTGQSLDAWVVQREVQDPAEYAEIWIRDAGQHLGTDADDLYAAWLDDFASRDVTAIGFGLITLRRPASGTATLRRLEERRGEAGLPTGNLLLAGLLAHDWLTRHDDQALLSTALQVAGDVTEERHHLPGAEDPSVILLRQGGGAQRVIQASTELAGFVGACSGDLATGPLIGALAQILERDEAGLRAELLPQVRLLVADGLLLP